LLEDKDTQEKLREAINLIYNFQFPQAEPLIKTIRERYPQHPVYPMLMSLKLFWQGMPLRKENPLYPEYLDHLRKTLKQTSLLIDKSPHDPEATFFALAAHSYLALQASEEGQSMEVLAEARKAYGYLRAGSKLTQTYPDFLFSTGLYNYYVVQYPATHPAVKPLMVFFADGDKAKGLQQLEKAAGEGVFTRTEALFYLMHITVKHESQFSRALGYSSRLVTRFPGNLLYKMRHAELLVLNGRYREAVPLIREIQAHPDKVYQATAEILLGLIAEKSEKNVEKARGHFIRALRLKAYERRYTRICMQWPMPDWPVWLQGMVTTKEPGLIIRKHWNWPSTKVPSGKPGTI
jgi:tetratricopeptide (TPR) repeat protein